MEKRVIFHNAAGSMSVIIPAFGSGLTIEQIAEKDVPRGKPFKIIDASAIPADWEGGENWSVDISEMTDGVGAGPQ